ncbi:DUF930 domain-containing protein [Mycoplana dimorpha]|uniref:DUF930 domain-containing protein n=1 Tax=Mycoplana dimorpha TaxID=28320 RepID=UPI0014733D14|nr:DUF930 domain-containing protein [Mycoplana dimorpha]
MPSAAEESISVELVPPPQEAAQQPTPEEKQQQEATPPSPDEPEEMTPDMEAQPEGQADGPAPGKVPIPVLRPVFEFADKVTGSDGVDIAAAKTVPAERPSAKVAEAPPSAPSGATEKSDSATPSATAELPDAGPGDLPAEVEESTALEEPPVDGGPAEEAITEAEQASDQPGLENETLTEAGRLFSESITDDPVARTAIADLPRGARVEQLCSTELYAQLRHASPPHKPDLLPTFRLSRGTVLEVRRAAFRANARWYDLSFRCEVDGDATRVVSFAFAVGAEVPRSEWQTRGFPVW